MLLRLLLKNNQKLTRLRHPKEEAGNSACDLMVSPVPWTGFVLIHFSFSLFLTRLKFQLVFP
jgi:hypothetical protein